VPSFPANGYYRRFSGVPYFRVHDDGISAFPRPSTIFRLRNEENSGPFTP
jgi:hypothetical protein